MKKLSMAILAISLWLPVRAQSNGGDNSKYCAEMKDGILVIANDGDISKSDIALESGVTIKLNGEVILNDGSRFVLSDGDCIDKDGNLINESPGEEPKIK